MANGIGRFQHGDGDVAGLNGSRPGCFFDRPVGAECVPLYFMKWGDRIWHMEWRYIHEFMASVALPFFEHAAWAFIVSFLNERRCVPSVPDPSTQRNTLALTVDHQGEHRIQIAPNGRPTQWPQFRHGNEIPGLRGPVEKRQSRWPRAVYAPWYWQIGHTHRRWCMHIYI